MSMTSKRCFIVLFALLFPLLGVSAAGQKKVLLIHSYNEDLAWTRQLDKGVLAVLPDDVELRKAYLDTKRIPKSQFADKAREALDIFGTYDPDVVMLGDDNALRLLGPPIAETGKPVVYFGINNNPRQYFETLPPNVVGVLERIPLFHWVRVLMRIVPDARSLLVLMDDSPTAEAIYASAFKGRDFVSFDGAVVRCMRAHSWSGWQRIVTEEEHDLILMPIYHALRADSGRHITYEEVIAWTSKNSCSPVFATQDYAVGDDGVVGAWVIQGEQHGRRAGRIVAGILKEGIRNSADGDQGGVLYLNERQLRRFGLEVPQDLREEAVFKH